jgi:hypothetical protein
VIDFLKKKEYGQEGTRKRARGRNVQAPVPPVSFFFVYEWRLTGRFYRLDRRPRRI